MLRRVVHRGPLGRYRGQSGYEGATNPGWVAWTPAIATGFTAVYAAAHPEKGWVGWVVLVLLVWTVVQSLHGIVSRARYCQQHGHDPYRPVAHLAEYRCWRCSAHLDDVQPDAVQTTARRVRQSYYSDRR